VPGRPPPPRSHWCVLDQIPAPARTTRIRLDDLDDPEAMRLLAYNVELSRLHTD